MHRAQAYAVALLLVGASFVLRLALFPWLGVSVPYLQFFPAITLASWYGGFGPGGLATVVSTLIAMYYFLAPAGFAVSGTADLAALPLFVATGFGIAWLSHLLRVSEAAHRKAADLAQARAARLDAVLRTAVDGIIVIGAEGHIEVFSGGAEKLFGYSEEDVLGRNVSMLMPPPHHEAHDQYLSRYLATGDARIIGTGREVMGRRRDGTTFPLHLSVGEMRIGGERKFTGMLHELSDRLRMEEQLREQAALARLGEMAAVVAHEVKNPLAGIRGAIQVLGGKLPPGGKEAMVVKEIVGRIDTLTGLMGDLLLFARPPQPRLTSVEIATLVATTAGLLAGDPALRGIDVEVEGTAPPVAGDPELLKIVFQNVLVNGAHAMQGKGRIHVDVRGVDSMCQVTFKDSGPGIPPEIREKVFTPFFTTKSHGSGLGLPTSKSLIEAHHGRISIQCPPGGGTAVTIQLPAS